MRARNGVAAVVLGVLLTGCGPDGPSTPDGTTTDTTAASRTSMTSASEATTTTTSATRTATGTATATTVPATSAGEVRYPISQQEYTSELVRAWGAGDQSRAVHYATTPAVQKLFGWRGRGGPSWSLLGCDNAGPLPACVFIERRTSRRIVFFYNADKLGMPHAVLDLEFLPAVATPTTQ